jgi:hypothetical protein
VLLRTNNRALVCKRMVDAWLQISLAYIGICLVGGLALTVGEAPCYIVHFVTLPHRVTAVLWRDSMRSSLAALVLSQSNGGNTLLCVRCEPRWLTKLVFRLQSSSKCAWGYDSPLRYENLH